MIGKVGGKSSKVGGIKRRFGGINWKSSGITEESGGITIIDLEECFTETKKYIDWTHKVQKNPNYKTGNYRFL